MRLLVVFLFAVMFFSNAAYALEIEVQKGTIVNFPRPAAQVLIADTAVADIESRSPNYVYVYGSSVGETTLHALDSNNRTISQITVTVTPNLSGLTKIIKNIMPDADISFQTVGNGLVVKGEVESPQNAEHVVNLVNATLTDGQSLVNMLDVKGSDQVMLRVRIAEVQRSETKNFGINLGNVLTNTDFTFGMFTGRSFLNAGALVRSGNNIRIQGTAGDYTIDTVIDALEAEGLVKTLAEPNLTAKSGETATFLAGGEFPIPVPQDGGVIGIEYREFGVSLEFTPTVLSDKRISLTVAPEVSAFAASSVVIAGNTIPTLNTRSVSTTVELGSGQSFAVAGLIRNDVTHDISKFPWLGDVPVLGALFSSTNFVNSDSELVVIVTPYIVRGVDNADGLMTPTEGLESPNDFERILLGRLISNATETGRKPGEYEGKIAEYRLHGNPGFILEE